VEAAYATDCHCGHYHSLAHRQKLVAEVAADCSTWEEGRSLPFRRIMGGLFEFVSRPRLYSNGSVIRIRSSDCNIAPVKTKNLALTEEEEELVLYEVALQERSCAT